jgi:DNA-binding LacI/PurR family transcriptional regulator
MLLNKPDTLSSQIVLYFEKEIFEGRIKEGDRIPSTTLLADRFGVNPETVQTGLKRLMGRGLIERTPGKGTFARKGYNGKTIGIVFAHEMFADMNTAFYNIFLDELRNIIEKEGWSYKYFVTTRKSEYDRTFHNFEASVKNGEIQAIVEFCSNDLIQSWVKSSSIPHSNTEVMVDHYDFTVKGLRYLVGQGYKSIALINRIDGSSENQTQNAISEIYSEFHLKDGAIQVFNCDTFQKEGYEITKKLLKGKKKPDALLVGYDCIFRGVLYAILETGLRIPDDIAVLTHSNKGIDIFSHIPITRLEVDPADFARQTFEEIMCKVSGREYLMQHFKPVLIPGKSCGEK